MLEGDPPPHLVRSIQAERSSHNFCCFERKLKNTLNSCIFSKTRQTCQQANKQKITFARMMVPVHDNITVFSSL